MIESIDAMAAFARSLVTGCGHKLRSMRQSEALQARPKNGHSDIVTDHDLWVQQYLTRSIRRAYPTHSVLGEEGGGFQGSSDFTWVIDPIDGTTNYLHYGRGYAISVALLRGGAPAYGLVLDVAADRLHEGGVSPAAASGDQSPEEGILHMGYKTMQRFTQMGADPYALAARFQGVRYMGCASLELCAIARERCGFYVSTHLKLWDFAAAAAILSSQGCRLAAAELTSGQYFVCAFRSPALYQQCEPYFPAQARHALNLTGGPFHATD